MSQSCGKRHCANIVNMKLDIRYEGRHVLIKDSNSRGKGVKDPVFISSDIKY